MHDTISIYSMHHSSRIRILRFFENKKKRTCYTQDRPVNIHSVSMQDSPANSLSIHINTGPSCILNTDVAIYRAVLHTEGKMECTGK